MTVHVNEVSRIDMPAMSRAEEICHVDKRDHAIYWHFTNHQAVLLDPGKSQGHDTPSLTMSPAAFWVGECVACWIFSLYHAEGFDLEDVPESSRSLQHLHFSVVADVVAKARQP